MHRSTASQERPQGSSSWRGVRVRGPTSAVAPRIPPCGALLSRCRPSDGFSGPAIPSPRHGKGWLIPREQEQGLCAGRSPLRQCSAQPAYHPAAVHAIDPPGSFIAISSSIAELLPGCPILACRPDRSSFFIVMSQINKPSGPSSPRPTLPADMTLATSAISCCGIASRPTAWAGAPAAAHFELLKKLWASLRVQR